MYAIRSYYDPQAVENARTALKNGCKIYADTSMITVGVSKPSLAKLGCEITCYVHHEEVVAEAKALGIT